MYRTSELRIAESTKALPELSSGVITALSEERAVDVVSRIEILQTLAGYRWVGEASHEVHSTKPLEPTAQQVAALSLLERVGLAARYDSLERSGKYFSWIQFAVNQPMLEMFMDKNNPFNVIEEGAVYGYPVSSTLAFAGIIPKKLVRQKSIAEYYMFGVNSDKYYEREVEYAEKVWAHLCDLAPRLTNEARQEYAEITKKITASPQA